MELEESIVKRLQELKHWQMEQQETLLKQQQAQREQLSLEQERMYQALGLSSNDIGENLLQNVSTSERDNSTNIDNSLNNSDVQQLQYHENPHSGFQTAERNCEKKLPESFELPLNVPQLKLSTRNFQRQSGEPRNVPNFEEKDDFKDISIEGIQPLEKPLKSFLIDDVPVPSPKKDFHALLEERLRESEAIGNNENANSHTQTKRPFLKKGQGLARFNLNSASETRDKRFRSRSASVGSMQRSNARNATKNVEKPKEVPKVVNKQVNSRRSLALPARAQQLNLKNVPPPKKKVRSKSLSAVSNLRAAKESSDLSTSDFETKTQRELEEIKIFEFLEEKAENSSFCSTSSTVIAFLQQSTPKSNKLGRFLPKGNQKEVKEEKTTNKREVDNEVTKQMKNPKQEAEKCKELPVATWNTIPVGDSNNGKKVTSPRTIHTAKHFGFHAVQQSRSWYSERAGKCDTNEEISKSPANNGLDLMKLDAKDADNVNSDDARGNDSSSENISENEGEVSLHVRFAEYNEYKTIGLTDTSSTSSESLITSNFADEKAWSDCSITPDSSEVEVLYSRFKNCESKTRNILQQNPLEQRDKNSLDSNQESDNEVDGTENSDSTLLEDNSRDDPDVTIEECNTEMNSKSTKGLQQSAIFRSELLKTRLEELERELDIFRKENAALASQRQRLNEEQVKFMKEFKEKENNFEENRRRVENSLQEEKKKLARERSALESRIRENQERAQKSKQERLEIQGLKEQLEQLSEEMAQKESRWNATQARQRSQLRILQVENSKLKQELEKLQNKKPIRTRKSSLNTKAIHRINKELDRKKKSNSSSDEEEEEELVTSAKDSADSKLPVVDGQSQKDSTPENEKVNVPESASRVQESPKDFEGIERKRNLYKNLLKDATMGLSEVHSNRKIEDVYEKLKDRMDNTGQNVQETPGDEKENKVTCNGRDSKWTEHQGAQSNQRNGDETLKDVQKNPLQNNSTEEQNNRAIIREVEYPDGKIEYWYPNGNVKKVFPGGNLTKMIYYNGDVRETNKDGTVRYFYAATRTWHTTLPDGLEILEFPDGQVERRSVDGTIEVSFPDGSIRILQADGSETWALADGTTVETSPTGDKVLNLPNGQREIHTKDHKRREYPDGTVKLVYSDGTQETRYASGRVRLKDKDGNLLMDSHQ